MKDIILAMTITWLLTKITAIDKGWLWFYFAMGVLVRCGQNVGPGGVLVSTVIFKVVRDIFGRRKKKVDFRREWYILE